MAASTPGGVGFGVRKFGDWKEAQRILGTAGFRLPVAMNKALKQEAQFLRRKLIDNLKVGGTVGGTKFQALESTTLISRRFRKRRSKKPLIETADMRNSIKTVVRKGTAFVGILRSAVGKDGRSLIKLASVHEEGQTIAIPVTRAMLRFLHLMLRKGAKKSERTDGAMGVRLGEVLVVTIPPRPFIEPVVNRFFIKNKAAAKRRYMARVAILMAGDLGHVAIGISEFGAIGVFPLPVPAVPAGTEGS